MCGRRERESRHRALCPVFATVEGTLIHRAPVSLRGLPEERGSRSVRFACMGLVPTWAFAPATKGALWSPRRGTSSACAKRTHSRQVLLASRTRPSLGPGTRARQASLNSHGASRTRWGGRFGIAVGQTCASRRNRHRGLVERTTARLAARHRSRGKSQEAVRDAFRKGRWSWPSSLRGNESPELSARTS